jgi:asparagine synthetase B (glutamine-hydrolysing)
MCSLLFSTKTISNLNETNKFLVKRGPDKTNYVTFKDHHYIHNLLSITGTFTTQPLFNDSETIAVLFNGEIYNFKEFGDYDNDSKCIIPLYEKYGREFVKKLDGEYAIVIVDYKSSTILFTSDIFGTKPLFYSIDGGIGVSTYRSGLTSIGFKNIYKMEANTTIVYSLDGCLQSKKPIVDFDLKQYKTTYDDWILAFEASIRKRAFVNVREKLFIGLSSGYDSGAIACSLMKQNIPFKYYTVIGSENKRVLEERWKLLQGKCDSEITTIYPHDKNIAHNFLLNNTEDWKYTIYSNRSSYNEFDLSLWDDNGSNHLSHLCSLARRDGRKILLSGAGVDELHDYGWNGQSKYAHSNFGGLFPEDLTTIFPWPSFFKSSMESYLMKDEVVGGSYGMEVRYPFLDTKLVQEYLWLSTKLKNEKYKSEIHEYLSSNRFPFSPNEKIGF